jgi:hypothetical protein
MKSLEDGLGDRHKSLIACGLTALLHYHSDVTLFPADSDYTVEYI